MEVVKNMSIEFPGKVKINGFNGGDNMTGVEI